MLTPLHCRPSHASSSGRYPSVSLTVFPRRATVRTVYPVFLSESFTRYFLVSPLYRSDAALNLPHGSVTLPCPLIPLPTRTASNHSGFKTHSSFVPIEEASFIAP